jgi:uncharacterized membrane protein YgdD (TMEM256/DUF423 family)
MAQEIHSSPTDSSPRYSDLDPEREPTGKYSDFPPQRESARGLLSQLVDEVTTLLRKEVALARVEFSDALSKAKTGVTSVAAGGAVLFAGFLVLLAAAVLGLTNVVEPWLAALIVGGVVLIIGFVMLQIGKNKLEPSAFRPERTQSALRKDKEMMQRRTA